MQQSHLVSLVPLFPLLSGILVGLWSLFRAHTASGPTRLALRFGGVLQPLSVRRVRGARFQVIVHEPIPLERTGDRARDLAAGVAKVNAFVEEQKDNDTGCTLPELDGATRVARTGGHHFGGDYQEIAQIILDRLRAVSAER